MDSLNRASDGNIDKKKNDEKSKSAAAKRGPKDWANINKFLDTELEYLKDNQDAGIVFSMFFIWFLGSFGARESSNN